MQSGDFGPEAADVGELVMSVVEAVEKELEQAGSTGSALAETALALARELDGDNSATSKSMCAKSMVDVLRELRMLNPPKPEDDEIERARKRRADRMARKPAAGSAPSS